MASWNKIAKRIRVPMGFAFAVLYLWLARPSLAFMAASLLLVIPGLLLRGYASGYVKKNKELTTTGPYAYTRNPLYLGSMMMAFGLAAASLRWEIVVLLAILFVIIYLPTILSEEKYLQEHFTEFAAYAKRVPRLLPRLTPGTSNDSTGGGAGSFSAALYRKHREYNAGVGACAVYAALIALLVWRGLK